MFEASTLAQVILIDLLFAGDNAIAIGMVAAGLPQQQRQKVIAVGILLAVLFRIVLALVTVQLLKVPGLLIVGGLLLLWVCWRLFKDIGHEPSSQHATEGINTGEARSFKSALLQILIADITMSLDNVLAVAAIAKDHMVILIFGLLLSVALMLAGATMIANLLQKYKWIGYVGLILILFVAISMLWEGYHNIVTKITT